MQQRGMQDCGTKDVQPLSFGSRDRDASAGFTTCWLWELEQRIELLNADHSHHIPGAQSALKQAWREAGSLHLLAVGTGLVAVLVPKSQFSQV